MNNAKKELESCINFFLKTYSKKKCSFGLVPDSYPHTHEDVSSIAGSGYFFASLVLAVKYKMMSKEKAYNICLKAIKVINNLNNYHGWYSHFYSISTGKSFYKSEYSTIDTCLMIAGALTAGSYFKKDVLKIAKEILNRCNFKYILQEYKTMFSMSIEYNFEFRGHWDRYAEQLIMYVLGRAVTNKNHQMPKYIYYSFIRDYGKYNNHEFIYSWHNSLFTHQYSHGFIDFRNIVDKNRTDWFKNSIEASLANYEFCKSLSKQYKSINEHSWGLTACAVKDGYSGRFGSLPVGDYQVFHDGTMAPCGAIGSIVFTPKESLDAIDYYYKNNNLLGEFGLYDSYNIDKNFYCKYYIAIDKGISMVMLNNYFDGTIWEYFNKLDIIKESLKELGFKQKEK